MTALSEHPTDLEPSLVQERTYATRRSFGRIDAALVSAVMLGLLTILPTRLIVPGMTDLGRPALIVCFAMFWWWIMARLSPRLALVGPQPIRWAVLAYWLSILISYTIGYLRGLTPMEANAADRALLETAAFSGVILAAADGISNWERLRFVLRVLVWCSAFMAVIGLIQATLPIDPVQFMTLPGLQSKGLISFEARGGGVRVPGTASHYLELAGVLATALPFALHFALFPREPRDRLRFVIASMLIVAGIFVTISRTGMVSIFVAVLVLMPLWTWRLRYNVLAIGCGLLAGLAVAKPSMVRTLFDLFLSAGNDPSIDSRTERYPLVGRYFAQRPWFGRGSGTWVPPQYQYLDNQWLGVALTNGVVGVAVLAALHITALTLSAIALRRSASLEDRHLCAALISTQIIAMFAAATFDSLSFGTYATVVALTMGICAAMWRFTHPSRQVRTSTTLWFLRH